jgi:ABC transporter DrrB family efflux protein
MNRRHFFAAAAAAGVTVSPLVRAAGAAPAVGSRDELVTEVGARYIDFLLPGLLGLSLMSTGFWGIGFSLAEMRAKKLLKRIVATPMRRSDFLASFLIVRVVLLVVELPPLLFARLLFSITVRGSPVAFLVVVLLGAMMFATMGLAMASRAENPQIVSGLINVLSFPMYLCSGVFFSAARFPARVQPVIRLLPLSALNEALRAIMIDGGGFAEIGRQLLVMAVWLVVSFALALRLFKWR